MTSDATTTSHFTETTIKSDSTEVAFKSEVNPYHNDKLMLMTLVIATIVTFLL
ncbi:MAG: hypothetical protein ACXACU_17610 [Candidatus Hodarchaeales archaeon]